jgi:DNA-binding NarL/FixJ family response regulator
MSKQTDPLGDARQYWPLGAADIQGRNLPYDFKVWQAGIWKGFTLAYPENSYRVLADLLSTRQSPVFSCVVTRDDQTVKQYRIGADGHEVELSVVDSGADVPTLQLVDKTNCAPPNPTGDIIHNFISGCLYFSERAFPSGLTRTEPTSIGPKRGRSQSKTQEMAERRAEAQKLKDEGRTIAEIAERLYVSEETIERDLGIRK